MGEFYGNIPGAVKKFILRRGEKIIKDTYRKSLDVPNDNHE